VSQIQTLNEIYVHAAERTVKADAFRTKRDGAYRDVSSQEFARAGTEIALGLVALGLRPGDRVAVLSETRLEWAQADMGILTAGLVSVPIYPTLPPSSVRYIVEDSGARFLFASNPEQAAKARGIAEKTGDFGVAVFDEEGGDLMTLDALRERGRTLGDGEPGLHRKRAAAAGPDDVATIIYTSGTTGDPKGVLLTHGNITSNVLAALEVFPLGPDDVSLSFLPLSHIFERMAGLYAMVYRGVSIAYAESIDTVPDNLREVRPTVVIAVPRFYEKMYARVLEAASGGGSVRKNLFFWARSVALAKTRREIAGGSPGPWANLQYRIAYALVFRKLRARTGGRLRFFVSGGAPLPRAIAEFFLAARLPILEGYGLTETSPVLTVNPIDAIRPGTVGKPIPGVEVRIAEDREILARGPNIMKGYHNKPAETEAALAGGWFHTGDIGHFDADGYLVITDRKKDLIVTAGGKNVAPQPIESLLKADKYVSEAVVIGDGRPYLVALVLPNFENVRKFLAARGISVAGDRELAGHPAVRELLMQRIKKRQKDAPPFEAVAKIHVLDRELVIGEELTPTLKVKRKEIGRVFHDAIEALYTNAS
jgi:long-chain acyl-CoA synthetase